jgi:hypothetical protein
LKPDGLRCPGAVIVFPDFECPSGPRVQPNSVWDLRESSGEGETGRAALVRSSYDFQANGVDSDGLANVLLSPRRKERVLVAATMFLRNCWDLARLEGRVAKRPSFWVKNVDIIRTYDRIGDAIVPRGT